MEERIIRVYDNKECKKYFGDRKIVTYQELVNVNLMQFLMKHQEKDIRNEKKR